jgi:hypothetical protein
LDVAFFCAGCIAAAASQGNRGAGDMGANAFTVPARLPVGRSPESGHEHKKAARCFQQA